MLRSSRVLALAIFFLLALLSVVRSARGQGEENWWYFDQGLHFTPAGPVVVPVPASVVIDAEEGSATVSDAAGNLLFYTDGSTIWTRQHRLMPGGTGLGLYYQYSSTQGALIVRDPGDGQRYYVFRQAAYGYPDGLGYVVVDMRLNGGLGAVTGPMVTLSPVRQLSEKLAGIVHANGRDTWVLTHGIRSDVYYAFLVSPLGVNPTPVATAVGLPHGPVGGAPGQAGFLGCLRSSPDGTKLASAVSRHAQLELLDFDPATGRPSNPVRLGPLPEVYGVEFSADGSKLYATTEIYRTVVQFDLLTGPVPPAVVVGTLPDLNGSTGALLRGPDGRVYVAQEGPYLGVIEDPSVAGPACGYRAQAVRARNTYGLPVFPNRHPGPGRNYARLTVAGNESCPGQAITFSATWTPSSPPAGSTYAWTFGDPTAGAANTATTPAHVFSRAGTYLVALRVTAPDGAAVAYATTLVTVLAPPVLAMGPRTRLLCPGDALQLEAGGGTGITYRWQDGTTGSRYRVHAPGTYRVTATNAAGCAVRDSVVVRAAAAPIVSLGPDTTVCAVAPALVLRPSPQPPGTGFRWPDGSTGGTLMASGPGLYWVEVRNAAGCATRAQVNVRVRACPALIPNIITPNGDGRNDTWAWQGLVPAEWRVHIYTRWGVEVFSAEAYNNAWAAPQLAEGVYYYRLEHRTNRQQQRGWLQVMKQL